MIGSAIMPNIRPISDLRNKANEISEFCHSDDEPVFITKNGVGDLAVMSIENYERQQALLELFSKMFEVEVEIKKDEEGEDFFEVAKQLRKKVHGKI
jgi:prevent-host-death family protein